MAAVSPQSRRAGENRVLEDSRCFFSRVLPNKHPLRCNLTRFTSCAPDYFVCAFHRSIQFIQRLQLNFPLPLICSLAASQAKESIDLCLLCFSSASSLASWYVYICLMVGERTLKEIWQDASMCVWVGWCGGLLSSVKYGCGKGREVCEGVGKQKGRDEREMRLRVRMFPWPCSLYLWRAVFDGDTYDSAFMTDISPRIICGGGFFLGKCPNHTIFCWFSWPDSIEI